MALSVVAITDTDFIKMGQLRVHDEVRNGHRNHSGRELSGSAAVSHDAAFSRFRVYRNQKSEINQELCYVDKADIAKFQGQSQT